MIGCPIGSQPSSPSDLHQPMTILRGSILIHCDHSFEMGGSWPRSAYVCSLLDHIVCVLRSRRTCQLRIFTEPGITTFHARQRCMNVIAKEASIEEPWPNFSAPGQLLLLAWQAGSAARELQAHLWHIWCQACLAPMWPAHPHETGGQLEVPDPIAFCSEQDLFA